jgi:mono/diheme cytochrome c family protein
MRSPDMLAPRFFRVPLRAAVLLFSTLFAVAMVNQAQAQSALADQIDGLQEILAEYCSSCHNDQARVADLSFSSLDLSQLGAFGHIPERILGKLRSGQMPPVGMPRPAADEYDALINWFESELDRFAAANPNPGRTESLHRLNRAEYANAVRDLLALDVDVQVLLPADDIDAYGFDNIADGLTISPALMERYLSAARKTARLAVGEEPLGPVADTYEVPILYKQNDRMSDVLPFGSRGGIGISHYFPVEGEYDLAIRLHRNYVNYVRGMGSRHELEVRLDGVLVRTFTFGGEEPDVLQAPASYGGNQFGDPEWEQYMLFADSNLRFRFPAEAGPHIVGVSFVRKLTEPEGVLQPPQSVFAAAVNEMRDGDAAVEQVAITGPFETNGPGNTPSRRAVFSCQPANDTATEEDACASEILSSLARRAYRRPLENSDLATLMNFYRAGRDEGSFDAGIQLALERLLISPDFLFRVERDPGTIEPGTNYKLSDLELASRLSFFLWSSIPDSELLEAAENGLLQNPQILEQQSRRMLSDSRSRSLVHNFAAQWLYLRNLPSLVPDAVAFPEFDENLRDAFRQESELFFQSMLREDHSVLDLLGAGYTYVNERLAEHYGISGVYGSHFRRVALTGELAEQRGSILGQGSLLTATSYANRTSPVLRGKWVLTNILGTPPPAPPPNVPDLPDNGEDGQPATVRDRMIKHRENPVCRSCHAPMDPLGLALENYDAIGRWRTTGEADLAIDASGQLPNGTEFYGPLGLRTLLLERGEQFSATVTEKLLAYAIGRSPEYYDKPSVRNITRAAALENYSWSSIIVGIVQSDPFRMQRSQ